MSSILLSLILLSPSTLAVSKSSLFVGGSIAFESYGGKYYEVDGKRLSSLQLMPVIEHLFIKRLGTGLEINFKRQVQGDTKLTAIDMGPHMTYYIPTGTNNFIFLRGSLHLWVFNLKYNDWESEQSGSIYGIEVGWGNLITPHLVLVTSLYYRYHKLDKGVSENENSGNIIGMKVTLGGFLYRER